MNIYNELTPEQREDFRRKLGTMNSALGLWEKWGAAHQWNCTPGSEGAYLEPYRINNNGTMRRDIGASLYVRYLEGFDTPMLPNLWTILEANGWKRINTDITTWRKERNAAKKAAREARKKI